MVVCDANASSTHTRRVVLQHRACQEVCEGALGHPGGWPLFQVQERRDEPLERTLSHCKDERTLQYFLHIFPCVHLEVVLISLSPPLPTWMSNPVSLAILKNIDLVIFLAVPSNSKEDFVKPKPDICCGSRLRNIAPEDVAARFVKESATGDFL